jgi:hypothetical protein
VHTLSSMQCGSYNSLQYKDNRRAILFIGKDPQVPSYWKVIGTKYQEPRLAVVRDQMFIRDIRQDLYLTKDVKLLLYLEDRLSPTKKISVTIPTIPKPENGAKAVTDAVNKFVELVEPKPRKETARKNLKKTAAFLRAGRIVAYYLPVASVF